MAYLKYAVPFRRTVLYWREDSVTFDRLYCSRRTFQKIGMPCTIPVSSRRSAICCT